MSFIDAIRARASERGHAQLVSDLTGYLGASAAALLIDFLTLTLLHKVFGLSHLIAAAVGFLSGLALVYWLSVRYVFNDRRRFGARAEVTGFLLTGLGGLALTEAMMHFFVDQAGLPPLAAKIPTAGLVFLFNFTLRRALIFSNRPLGDRAR